MKTQIILDALTDGTKTLGQLVSATGYTASVVETGLQVLETQGLAVEITDGTFGLTTLGAKQIVPTPAPAPTQHQAQPGDIKEIITDFLHQGGACIDFIVDSTRLDYLTVEEALDKMTMEGIVMQTVDDEVWWLVEDLEFTDETEQADETLALAQARADADAAAISTHGDRYENTKDEYFLALDKINITGGTQPRTKIDQDTVDEYIELLEGNVGIFPPVIVFFDGVSHWLADGFHRYYASVKLGLGYIHAKIKTGTVRDAILHSVGANSSHGLKRTPEDKKKAVMTLLSDAEWGEWSDREIARRCDVSHRYVSQLHKKLSVLVDTDVTGNVYSENPGSDTETPIETQTRKYTNKYGKTATMNTAAIGKTATAPTAPVEEPAPTLTPTPSPTLTPTPVSTPEPEPNPVIDTGADVDTGDREFTDADFPTPAEMQYLMAQTKLSTDQTATLIAFQDAWVALDQEIQVAFACWARCGFPNHRPMIESNN